MKEFLKEMYGDQFGEFVWGYWGGGGGGGGHEGLTLFGEN